MPECALLLNLLNSVKPLMSLPTLFSFPNSFVQDHYREGYQTPQWVQKNCAKDYFTFDLDNYQALWQAQLIQLLIDKHIINHAIPLQDLHIYLSQEWKAYGNDGIGKIGTLFYETNAAFKLALHEFLYHVLYKKVIKQPFLFQATPTFRVHCPGSTNAEFFPHYHTDLAVGHPPYTMNLWIPLTPQGSGHGFYVASLKDSNKIANFIDYDVPALMDESVFRNQDYLSFCEPCFDPVDVELGHGLLFDSRCFHTAMPISDHTRISMDLRIVLQEDFDKAGFIYESRGRRKQLKLLPGEYYNSVTANELID
jgi:hypothetical protein